MVTKADQKSRNRRPEDMILGGIEHCRRYPLPHRQPSISWKSHHLVSSTPIHRWLYRYKPCYGFHFEFHAFLSCSQLQFLFFQLILLWLPFHRFHFTVWVKQSRRTVACFCVGYIKKESFYVRKGSSLLDFEYNLEAFSSSLLALEAQTATCLRHKSHHQGSQIYQLFEQVFQDAETSSTPRTLMRKTPIQSLVRELGRSLRICSEEGIFGKRRRQNSECMKGFTRRAHTYHSSSLFAACLCKPWILIEDSSSAPCLYHTKLFLSLEICLNSDEPFEASSASCCYYLNATI